MRPLLFLRDACYIVVCLRQAELIDELHRMVIVRPGQERIRLFGLGNYRLNCFRHIGTVNVEGLRMLIEHNACVAADVTTSHELRLQFLDGDAQLHVVGEACLFVEVYVEATDVVVRRGQSAVEQFALAHDFHAQSACTDEGQHCLRNQAGTLPHSFRLVRAAQIVHLEQNQSVVRLHHALSVPVQKHSREADVRQQFFPRMAGIVCLSKSFLNGFQWVSLT